MKGRLLSVLDLALEDFNAMRTTEGGRLAEDVLGRADTIEKLLGEVEERSPQTVNDYRTRLEAKMREVLQNTQIDEGRLITEAAIFADKVAVDEETVRLSDVEITRRVVDMKAEIEKIREQVQNLE